VICLPAFLRCTYTVCSFGLGLSCAGKSQSEPRAKKLHFGHQRRSGTCGESAIQESSGVVSDAKKVCRRRVLHVQVVEAPAGATSTCPQWVKVISTLYVHTLWYSHRVSTYTNASLAAASPFMRLWFARDIWRYRNVFWLIDWFSYLRRASAASFWFLCRLSWGENPQSYMGHKRKNISFCADKTKLTNHGVNA